MEFEAWIAARRRDVDEAILRLLPDSSGPAGTVAQAMRYAVTAGGKRLRPILVLAVCEAAGGDTDGVVEAAAALEFLHTYSLIHDDLPAMDDDDLRRGRPTVHRAYGEAEAILAGDALQTLAFEVLGTWPRGDAAAARRAEAVVVLARAAGVAGMVGGQMADLEGERAPVDGDGLRWIHRHKTGCLIAASAEIGAIHADASSVLREAFRAFGMAIGLAFQIADDVLDRTSTAEELGKTPGKDERAHKATYPALYGLDASRAEAARLVDQAVAALEPHGLAAPTLRDLAGLTVRRSH